MAPRTHVQLIEKVQLRSSMWLTFWDLTEKVQLSIQIDEPAPSYEVGEVFTLDRTAKRAELALARFSEKIDANALLIPRKVVPAKRRNVWASVIKPRAKPKLGNHVVIRSGGPGRRILQLNRPKAEITTGNLKVEGHNTAPDIYLGTIIK